ncbi:cytochrome P450 [Coprinellus micaceus]|uniref:Cytochrome P450 n=1 Tax=Coprinellus micaceus TaxID=71717 RepID=A0A4Y7TIV4_COPMI|nr:cytochrome P450 [Coprinellus micaceus]
MSTTLICVAFASFWALWGIFRRSRVSLPHPPGPKGWPILGNLFDVPKEEPWAGYKDLSKKYGKPRACDMLYLNVLGQPMLILSSAKRSRDLFELRSTNYSGRPRLPMIDELGYADGGWAIMDYGPKWRKNRRTFHQYFNASAIPQYRPIIDHQLHRFLQWMLESPKDFEQHCMTLFGATITHVAYGLKDLTHEHPFLLELEEVMDAFKVAAVPGTFLVDVLPVLKYVPSWFPGAGFKRWANGYREKEIHARHGFLPVFPRPSSGEAEPSVASLSIAKFSTEDEAVREEQEELARNTTWMAFIGEPLAFILAMVKYPEIQVKAQEELDTVVGHGRLPGHEDKDKLIYLQALMMEMLRWYSVTPFALPHTSTEDDVYEGYLIPKGTVIIPNVWAILHDEDVYESPGELIPERFLTPEGGINHELPDPRTVAFGFGRRICPGRYLSADAMYMMMATTLALFDILPPKDDFGNPIEVNPKLKLGNPS